jgi:hypothetical protein
LRKEQLATGRARSTQDGWANGAHTGINPANDLFTVIDRPVVALLCGQVETARPAMQLGPPESGGANIDIEVENAIICNVQHDRMHVPGDDCRSIICGFKSETRSPRAALPTSRNKQLWVSDSKCCRHDPGVTANRAAWPVCGNWARGPPLVHRSRVQKACMDNAKRTQLLRLGPGLLALR